MIQSEQSETCCVGKYAILSRVRWGLAHLLPILAFLLSPNIRKLATTALCQRSLLADFVTYVIDAGDQRNDQGDVPHIVALILSSAKLIALTKDNIKHRPIAI